MSFPSSRPISDLQWSAAKRRILNKDDKSVDVYVGPKAPAGKENNWAQTIPGKG
jgi:hypothetical protein